MNMYQHAHHRLYLVEFSVVVSQASSLFRGEQIHMTVGANRPIAVIFYTIAELWLFKPRASLGNHLQHPNEDDHAVEDKGSQLHDPEQLGVALVTVAGLPEAKRLLDQMLACLACLA